MADETDGAGERGLVQGKDYSLPIMQHDEALTLQRYAIVKKP